MVHPRFDPTERDALHGLHNLFLVKLDCLLRCLLIIWLFNIAMENPL